MRKDITYYLLLSWLVFLSPVAIADNNYDGLIEDSFKSRRNGFANLEHLSIGNGVILKWGNLSHQQANNHIMMTNGLVLSYGELIMLAGDLFGSKNHSISSCSPELRDMCFYQQFETLDGYGSNKYQNALTQVPTYRQYFKRLSDDMKQAKKNGESAWQYYFNHGIDISKTLNRISGGGSFISDFIPFGEYIKLASVNFDHFYPGAITAYKTGHKLALDNAILAHKADLAGDKSKAYKLLSHAYAINGFANHFLTDVMSSGHMRTPRRKIAERLFLPRVLCLLIANLMHDEDNRTGLNVSNKRGISWRAFGDGFLNKPEAYQHLSLIRQIVQESADEVYATYESGDMPTQYSELTLLPDYNIINDLNNHPPLFKWQNSRLLKRKNNFDIYEDHYTAWWSGIYTLIQFNFHNRKQPKPD